MFSFEGQSHAQALSSFKVSTSGFDLQASQKLTLSILGQSQA
jgi:hypothetical protein